MTSKRLHLFVSGIVQGVYFRQSLKETADKNNVLGWVQNLPDQGVEAVLEGEESHVEAVVDWAHFGPAGAVVEDLKIMDEPYKREFSNFEIRY